MKKELQQDHFKVKIAEKEAQAQYLHGRGAQLNTRNRF